ncbi:3-phosphoshikimate 1-carboxyvinyltransferase [Sutcliffiella rhizosphaerae]|uniref:3-phosphoshikimate 1-carboxyvinyltransferase n=1 Tax=Sutcliffiella rhizosphaerae TaxID=2880967 RepID=A0ABM8YRL9_9BACI|nr:3-phosphoshikimate 1-carboxyvinyltransferase [Sutcliffiella rhizosphaerae]CAG9622645.1 3-phosphoshikimate 1-carboxyvinyltransferase 1 [Sutcliffiella rhizosphaerae]
MIKLSNVASGLNGTIKIPGDKSISHRSVMFGAMAKGKTTVENFLLGEDCLSTIDCFTKLGVTIEKNGSNITVYGNGLEGLTEPTDILDVGNSGTTARLIIGILSGLPFHSVLIGDESIAKRPMKRVTGPLKEMGARIQGNQDGNFTPISIQGGHLRAIDFVSPVASAQVKSAILLAGIQGIGTTTVKEPYKSRDHTERMLRAFGVRVEEDEFTVSVQGGQELKANLHIIVPGDISSAAFYLVAGAIVPNSKITLERVGLNPTRTGILDVLKKMGATMSFSNVEEEAPEPFADITIETSTLNGTEVSGDIIPRLIDEIPIIALMATQAEGTTVIKDAEELKVKETNRIDTVVNELRKMGADIEATDDGMVIKGKSMLTGTNLNSYGDHRIGMMGAIASLIANGETSLENAEAINVSYPNFFEHMEELKKGKE